MDDYPEESVREELLSLDWLSLTEERLSDFMGWRVTFDNSVDVLEMPESLDEPELLLE